MQLNKHTKTFILYLKRIWWVTSHSTHADSGDQLNESYDDSSEDEFED